MIGPEVLNLFAASGKEAAFCLWVRLQQSDVMHFPIKNGLHFIGVHAVTLEQIQSWFPTRSIKTIRRWLDDIESVVGLLKEPRRNPRTGQSDGFAYFPFMMYGPEDRILKNVPKDVENLTEAMSYQ
jgi:hypothetical protein